MALSSETIMSRKKARQIPKRVLRLPELDFFKERCPDHLPIVGVQAIVSIRNRRLRRMVLLRAATRFSKTSCSSMASSRSRRRLSIYDHLRLVSVRRLAYEDADTGPLSPELEAGISG
jgi:hypothetical protein